MLPSDAFTRAWLELNKAAQKGFIAILQKEPSGPIELQGDDVVLNLDSVIALAQEKLVESGISFGRQHHSSRNRQAVRP